MPTTRFYADAPIRCDELFEEIGKTNILLLCEAERILRPRPAGTVVDRPLVEGVVLNDVHVEVSRGCLECGGVAPVSITAFLLGRCVCALCGVENFDPVANVRYEVWTSETGEKELGIMPGLDVYVIKIWWQDEEEFDASPLVHLLKHRACGGQFTRLDEVG